MFSPSLRLSKKLIEFLKSEMRALTSQDKGEKREQIRTYWSKVFVLKAGDVFRELGETGPAYILNA